MSQLLSVQVGTPQLLVDVAWDATKRGTSSVSLV